MVMMFFFLMICRPPGTTHTDNLFPYTTLFRSKWLGLFVAVRGNRCPCPPRGIENERASRAEGEIDVATRQALRGSAFGEQQAAVHRHARYMVNGVAAGIAAVRTTVHDRPVSPNGPSAGASAGNSGAKPPGGAAADGAAPRSDPAKHGRT